MRVPIDMLDHAFAPTHTRVATIDNYNSRVGMLSMRDLMRVELGEQGDEIKLLHEYIQH